MVDNVLTSMHSFVFNGLFFICACCYNVAYARAHAITMRHANLQGTLCSFCQPTRLHTHTHNNILFILSARASAVDRPSVRRARAYECPAYDRLGGGVRGHWNCLPAIFTLFPLRPTFIDTHRCTHTHTHGCALVSRSLRVPIRVLPSICLTPFHYRSAAVHGAISFAVRARARVRLPSNTVDRLARAAARSKSRARTQHCFAGRTSQPPLGGLGAKCERTRA